MASDFDWEREERLTSLLRAAGFERSEVFVIERLPEDGLEGDHWFGGPDLFVSVASWLTDPEAEATALHEQAHVELGHDDDPGYPAALMTDQAAGIDHHRGPWEVEADALAAALVETVADRMTDARRSLEFLAEDVARFAP